MSGDVQPRKRKEKRKKKEESSEEFVNNFSSDETIHVHKDSGTGGNICAKIIFFVLLSVLLVLIGFIINEYRGSTDLNSPLLESRWAPVFDGWIDDSTVKVDDHGDPDEQEDENGIQHEHSDNNEHDPYDKEDEKEESKEHEIDKEEEEEEEDGDDDDDEEEEDEEEEDGEDDEEGRDNEDDVSKEKYFSDVDELKPLESLADSHEVSEEEASNLLENDEDNGDDESEKNNYENVDNESEDNADNGSDEDDGFAHSREDDIPGITESIEVGDTYEEENEVEDDEEEMNDAQNNRESDTNFSDENGSQADEDVDDGDGDASDIMEGIQSSVENRFNTVKINKKDHNDNDDEEEEEEEEEEEQEEEQEQEQEENGDDGDGSESKAEEPEPIGASSSTSHSKAVNEEKKKPSLTSHGTISQSTSRGNEANKNADDWLLQSELNNVDAELDANLEAALKTFKTTLLKTPDFLPAIYGKAKALDRIADIKRNNMILDEAIEEYIKILKFEKDMPHKKYLEIATRCLNRMRFRGHYLKAVQIHKFLIARFPDVPLYSNELAVTFLIMNRIKDAKQILAESLRKWPYDGFAQVHYGFILKTADNNMESAVEYLQKGILSRAPGTIDGRFFFQLGDALMRLGRKNEAMKVNELGVEEGLFLSKYQRSLYNVGRLLAQPWWTTEETTYSSYFQRLSNNWQTIREEGLNALFSSNLELYKHESENLKNSGQWKQLELFARGLKITRNCNIVPITCKLIETFPAARSCKRGQVKFSVMEPGTRVWPHCGPTNCRLRAHLGLVVPNNTFIRVAEETRSWEEGKLLIFDDSFEHEVWHNGSTMRLILIVDVWHPDLTEGERNNLSPI